jgi:single-strand DNA-binding protein
MQKNRIELAGFLAAKPEVRHLPSGTPVANARLAEGYRFTDRNNQTQEHTNWHNLVFYGDLADIAATYEKGENLFVEGTLQTRKFTPSDGSQRTVYEVIVRSSNLITKPRIAREAQSDNVPASTQPAPSNPQVEEEGHEPIWPM